ncbi:carboxymuconolactone decarboxylase family protein [Terrabacter terrigena]|uniref:Carboxymuconolactone decarboxylase family protein n=1 Tax=Terrabacter terrigena TaxID=574718 RepID=A0ABW3N179_9MICO
MGERESSYEQLASRLAQAAWENPALSPRQKHLVLLAEAAAKASRDPEGIARHVAALMDLGCSATEVLEVGELASVLPIHACTEGMPALATAAHRSAAAIAAGFDVAKALVKQDFEVKRGYWNDFWTVLLGYDRPFFEAYADLSSHAWQVGVLEPYERELVYLGFDASPQHLYRPGIGIHAANAMRLGATEAQIANVFTLLGVADTAAYDLVADELERCRQD